MPADETPRPIASLAAGDLTSEGIAAYQVETVQFEHLCQFIGLQDLDFQLLQQYQAALHVIADRVSPQVYKHLIAFQVTRDGLVSRRQSNATKSSLADLTSERTKKFACYLKQLFSWPAHDLPGLQKLMNGISLLHHKYVNVPLSHLILSLGATQTLMVNAVNEDNNIDNKSDLLNAVSKLLWLQADSFTQTYIQYHNTNTPQHTTKTNPPIPETSEQNSSVEDPDDE